MIAGPQPDRLKGSSTGAEWADLALVSSLTAGETRTLLRAEWGAIARERRRGAWLLAALGAACLGFAAVAAYGGVLEARRPGGMGPWVPAALALVFAGPAAASLNAAYLAAAERPWGRGRRVGRLCGPVGVDARSGFVTVGDTAVLPPKAWAGTWAGGGHGDAHLGARRGATADVEVTPPPAPAGGWLARHAARTVVAVRDGAAPGGWRRIAAAASSPALGPVSRAG